MSIKGASAALMIVVLGFCSGTATAGIKEVQLPNRSVGLAIDSSNNAWVANRGATGIIKYDPQLQVVGSAATAGHPWDVAVDPAGNYYAVEAVDGEAHSTKLRKYDGSGVQQWEADVDGIEDIVYSDGKIFGDEILGPAGGYALRVFDATDGDSLDDFDGDLSDPSRQTDGDLLLFNRDTGRIEEYSPSGAKKADPPNIIGPGYYSVTAGVGDELVADFTSRAPGRIKKFDGAGQLIGYAAYPWQSRDHEVAPDGSYWTVNGGRGPYYVARIDDRTPVAFLEAIAGPVETGDPIAFDAGKSNVSFSEVEKFEWDFDGDGVFDQETGTAATVTHEYSEPGEVSPRVRVTAPGGLTDTASISFDVRRKPAAGPVGVSINDGQIYTNDPDVQVRMRWPRHSLDALLSNDGGFFDAVSKPVSDVVTWRLAESGPERLPKTIYVRFTGGGNEQQTYQDDIILDQTPPVILSTKASTSSVAAGVSARKKKPRKKLIRVVRVRAQDKTSGVARMQITPTKSKPGAWRAYKGKVRVKPARKLFVRVRDRAGNDSRWKTLKP